jgi:hypothetical protein
VPCLDSIPYTRLCRSPSSRSTSKSRRRLAWKLSLRIRGRVSSPLTVIDHESRTLSGEAWLSRRSIRDSAVSIVEHPTVVPELGAVFFTAVDSAWRERRLEVGSGSSLRGSSSAFVSTEGRTTLR